MLLGCMVKQIRLRLHFRGNVTLMKFSWKLSPLKHLSVQFWILYINYKNHEIILLLTYALYGELGKSFYGNMVSQVGDLFIIQWNLYKADTIGAWKKCPLYGDVHFIEIPCKNEYLEKINQEWVFEVNGFRRVKSGHIEWNEKCFYFNNNKSNPTTSKQKVSNIDTLVH